MVTAMTNSRTITAAVFDLGGVLLDWDPRYLYRQLFADPAEMEDFLARICTADWHHAHDLGEDLTQSCRRLARLHPRYPDRRIFQILLRRYRLDPAATVFIDDSPGNVAAARGLSLRGLQYTSAGALRKQLRSLGLTALDPA